MELPQIVLGTFMFERTIGPNPIMAILVRNWLPTTTFGPTTVTYIIAIATRKVATLTEEMLLIDQ